MVATPTPALAAMSRTGASTPEATKTAAAASSRACWLRRASLRFDLAELPGLRPSSFTAALLRRPILQNGSAFRILGGTRFRFLHDGRAAGLRPTVALSTPVPAATAAR